MKSSIILYLLLFSLITTLSFSQDKNQFQEKSFLIIASTKKLSEAISIAKKASEKTGFQYRDKKVQADSLNGISFPPDSCLADGFSFPCYVARGRFDDGNYLSVEYSNGYPEFTRGYFIVIASSGDRSGPKFREAFKKIKTDYPKSYVKQAKVYIGCMH